MIDLRTFFGQWRVGQRVLVIGELARGNVKFISVVTEFSANQVSLAVTDPEMPFSLSLEIREENIYSFDIKPGIGAFPSYLSSDQIIGRVVPSPQSPDTLKLDGAITVSSTQNHYNVPGSVLY